LNLPPSSRGAQKDEGITIMAALSDEKDAKQKSSGQLQTTMKFTLIIGILAATLHRVGAFDALRQVDINALLSKTTQQISSMGPLKYPLFSGAYILLELLMIPAVPLTASAGALFGVVPGTAIVLFSATVAATISFLIGRFLLRGWAQKLTAGSKRWKAIDNAVSKQGLKVIFLLRVSPIFPFAIANYLYGLTSVDVKSYFLGTVLGFLPGTLGIVAFGQIGKDLLKQGPTAIPMWGWAAIIIAVAGIAKFFPPIIGQLVNDLGLNNDETKKN